LKYRGWEMLAGGLVYCIGEKTATDKKYPAIVAVTGIVIVVFSAVFFSSSSPWPGWRVALPVLGASLIILANKNGLTLYHFSFFQWIGYRSYSIYL
jgi:peptidoglycan/LPS O-acetylase OafA/YrhL